MDVATVDITNIKNCKIGDWCEFFSPEHSINNLASSNNLISYDTNLCYLLIYVQIISLDLNNE